MKYYCFFFILLFCRCQSKKPFDLIIKNGMIYDGNGGKPFHGDLAISGDTIAAIGDLGDAEAREVIDAKSMAVSPGFINMLSWANESLIEDGRSQGDIRQGVTLEVMGEGKSMGPLNAKMKSQSQSGQQDIKYTVNWNTLGEYLSGLEKRGISCNVASFVGATTLRTYIIGEDNVKANPAQLDSMRMLVKQAMEEGALGIGSSLIYPPAFFAGTDELIALCQEAAKYGGGYISHIRSEGNGLQEGIDELITISREAKIHSEVFHLKAGGKNNWNKMDSVIRKIETARASGLDITADIYTYVAGSTGLTACFPPTLQDGGFGALWKRLHDPAIRESMRIAMNTNTNEWDNFFYGSGSPDNILLLGFKQDSLKKYTGKTLTEMAKIRGKSPEMTAMDLIIEDSSRISTAYFYIDEENVKKEIVLPWVSFGSDAGSYTTSGVFLKSSTHPRAYGNFSRVLAKYVRDEKLLNLEEAIRKLSALPAHNLRIQKRGQLKTGYFADVLVFDPKLVQDNATFEKPHQYSTGMTHVFVNGKQVLKDGEHTGVKPGMFVKGPGYLKK